MNYFSEYDEKSPSVYETPSLGCDSVGTTYWFVLRRLILHSSEGTTYFSSKDKLDVVLAKLQSGSPEDVKVRKLVMWIFCICIVCTLYVNCTIGMYTVYVHRIYTVH